MDEGAWGESLRMMCVLGVWVLGFRVVLGFRATWTPKVCKIMAFMAIIRGLGVLFYNFLVFRASEDLKFRD